jgi:hypothetical protein
MQKLFTFCLDLGACSSITRTRPNRASCGTPSASLVQTRFVFHCPSVLARKRERHLEKQLQMSLAMTTRSGIRMLAGRLAGEEVWQPLELIILVDPPLI